VQVLGHQGAPPVECTPDIMREIIAQHLESPAMWAIFPLQVWPGPRAQPLPSSRALLRASGASYARSRGSCLAICGAPPVSRLVKFGDTCGLGSPHVEPQHCWCP